MFPSTASAERMKPDTRIAIRPLRQDERAQWDVLWKGYLDFYRTSVPSEVYDTTWARLHDPAEPMHLLGGTLDGALVGIVHYIYHRSCWTVGDYCYLQDLFVAESARKAGLGGALIEAVYREARAAGASRVHWLTHESNATARALYDTLAERPGFIQYRRLF
jgi:GNAT superfamily N-acetyltransferase